MHQRMGDIFKTSYPGNKKRRDQNNGGDGGGGGGGGHNNGGGGGGGGGGGHNNNNSCESPFDNNGGGHRHGGSFVLYLEPILNSYYQSYQNIITVSTIPPGPLSRLVSKIDMPKLSPYQQAAAYASPFYNGCNCVNALMRYPCDGYGGSGVFTPLHISNASLHRKVGGNECKGNVTTRITNAQRCKNADAFMGADDIPAVFSYLMNNGYTVDTSISKMMFQSRAMVGGVSDRRLSGDRKMIAFISLREPTVVSQSYDPSLMIPPF